MKTLDEAFDSLSPKAKKVYQMMEALSGALKKMGLRDLMALRDMGVYQSGHDPISPMLWESTEKAALFDEEFVNFCMEERQKVETDVEADYLAFIDRVCSKGTKDEEEDDDE